MTNESNAGHILAAKCFKSTLYLFLSLPLGEEMYPTEKLAFGSLLYVQNDLSFRVLSRPPMKICVSIGGRNLRLADDFLIGWFPPHPSWHIFPFLLAKYLQWMSSGIKPVLKSSFDHFDRRPENI